MPCRRCHHLPDRDERIPRWGNGSKAVTFLNLLDADGAVAAAVDIYPRKRVRFVACTGHRVVEPDTLVTSPPQRALVANPRCADQIDADLRFRGLDALLELV